MKKHKRLALPLLLTGAVAHAAAPMPRSPAAQQPNALPADVRLQGSVLHDLVSDRNGVTYNLTVLLPRNYNDGTDRHPVMYALDGSWLAPLVRSASFPVEKGLIVVGIDSEDPDHHWQDLPTAGHDRHWDVRPDRGAANFLQIILTEIKPYIDANYRTDLADTGIAGHSLGGFFALYAGFHAPDVFHHVVAFSPSLVWQDDVLRREQPDIAAKRKDMPVRFYVDVGGLEQQSDRITALGAAVLAQGYPSVRWENRTIPNQTHTTVAFADAVDAMQFVYGPDLRHPDDAELARVSGTYSLSDGTKLTLRSQAGQLVMVLSSFDNEPIDLLSTEPNKYFIRELGTRVEVRAPGATGADIILFKQATPGPGGANYVPKVTGTRDHAGSVSDRPPPSGPV